MVQFSGEDGADAGGPRREFFRLVIQEVSHSGLLEGSEGHMVFSHNLKLLEENHYFLAGCLVGMSIMQDGSGIACLDPTMYKLMCGLTVNLHDFEVDIITDQDFVETVKQ
ncbi:hypothetical protein QZH41_014646, partial [Actinostola sp. cb2023]